MYRIQAHNVQTGRIDVFIVDLMEDRIKLMRELESNPDYGLVTFEVNSRGSFYY